MNKPKILWDTNDETSISGYRISRGRKLQAGGRFYYVHWFEHPNRAASHSRMSSPLRSVVGCKHYILALEKTKTAFNLAQVREISQQMERLSNKHGRYTDKEHVISMRYDCLILGEDYGSGWTYQSIK